MKLSCFVFVEFLRKLFLVFQVDYTFMYVCKYLFYLPSIIFKLYISFLKNSRGKYSYVFDVQCAIIYTELLYH